MESELMLTPMVKIPCTGKILLRGRWNPGRCIKQDSEPNTLPTELLRPPAPHYEKDKDWKGRGKSLVYSTMTVPEVHQSVHTAASIQYNDSA